jgi:uncharacterized damage-inducible protein DinB
VPKHVRIGQARTPGSRSTGSRTAVITAPARYTSSVPDDALLLYYRAMALNNAWSNYRLLTACAALTQDEFTAPRVSFFPSLALTLNHLLLVDQYYLDALNGEPRAFRDETAPFSTVRLLQAAQSTSDRRLIAFCGGLRAEQFDRVVQLVRDVGVLEERTDRVLAHLFVHQIHHRGQAHAMLAGTNVAPPQLDEFLLATDAAARAADLPVLGFNEVDVWPPARS